MAWEKGIQVPYPFFVFAWHWKTDLNFAFCFSFSPNFEKRFWTSYFVFRFRITLKNGHQFQFSFFVFASVWKTDINFVFRFSFSHYFEKWIGISFLVFSSLWTTDLNFVCHFGMTWKRNHCTSSVIWSPATPSGLTGAFTFYVTESKWIFPSPGPKWVVNSAPPPPTPSPMTCLTHTRYSLF